jgi:hypothetical protein
LLQKNSEKLENFLLKNVEICLIMDNGKRAEIWSEYEISANLRIACKTILNKTLIFSDFRASKTSVETLGSKNS